MFSVGWGRGETSAHFANSLLDLRHITRQPRIASDRCQLLIDYLRTSRPKRTALARSERPGGATEPSSKVLNASLRPAEDSPPGQLSASFIHLTVVEGLVDECVLQPSRGLGAERLEGTGQGG